MTGIMYLLLKSSKLLQSKICKRQDTMTLAPLIEPNVMHIFTAEKKLSGPEKTNMHDDDADTGEQHNNLHFR